MAHQLPSRLRAEEEIWTSCKQARVLLLKMLACTRSSVEKAIGLLERGVSSSTHSLKQVKVSMRDF